MRGLAFRSILGCLARRFHHLRHIRCPNTATDLTTTRAAAIRCGVSLCSGTATGTTTRRTGSYAVVANSGSMAVGARLRCATVILIVTGASSIATATTATLTAITVGTSTGAELYGFRKGGAGDCAAFFIRGGAC